MLAAGRADGVASPPWQAGPALAESMYNKDVPAHNPQTPQRESGTPPGMGSAGAGGSASGSKRREWTPEEDEELEHLVEQLGTKKWAEIATRLTRRTGKQCRERWFNHLRKDIRRADWTEEEDLLIAEALEKYGKKWATIARLLPGRTEVAVKNHWFSAVRREERRKARVRAEHAAGAAGGNPLKSCVDALAARGMLVATPMQAHSPAGQPAPALGIQMTPMAMATAAAPAPTTHSLSQPQLLAPLPYSQPHSLAPHSHSTPRSLAPAPAAGLQYSDDTESRHVPASAHAPAAALASAWPAEPLALPPLQAPGDLQLPEDVAAAPYADPTASSSDSPCVGYESLRAELRRRLLERVTTEGEAPVADALLQYRPAMATRVTAGFEPDNRDRMVG